LDFKGGGEAGWFLFKARAEAGGGTKSSSSFEEVLKPTGRSLGDLSWVCQAILDSRKRLVLEDFHYISESVQQDLAFKLKAMGEYGLFLIIIGVWAKDHLLNYFNGDLDGRITDIHLKWSISELREVLSLGAHALNIEFSQVITEYLINDASGNVGLLQRLT
jgi:hypothetical protein